MARSKRGKIALPALTDANNAIPVQEGRVSKKGSEKQRIAAESSAVDKESSAIRKENAELEAERLAIEELKKFTPQDPQIPIRHQALKRQYALVGERGRNLGLRKAALKTAKARHTQQIEEAAERRMYAKAARELQQDLQSQQYTPAPAQSSDSYLQAQPQTQQIYTPSPTQPGNGYGQMHPQNQTLGVGDFLNAQQNPQMQSAAPAQSGYGYFQQHPQTQQMYAPTPVGSMQPKYPVNMQPPTHPSEIAALDTLSITDSSNITSNCNALQNALASTGGPVSFPLPTQVYVNYKTHTPQPVGRNWKDPSELAAWQKAQKLGKIVLQEEKLKETEQRKRELDHTPNEIALWQQRQREAARQQLEKKNTAGQQQMQMESDTSEVLYPDRLPARYGTGAYVGTGFSSPELTRDHSTILTQEMLHERDARRQVLNKIIHTQLVPLGLHEEQRKNDSRPASFYYPSYERRAEVVMGATAVAQESPSTFQPKVQAQPGGSMMGVIDLTEVVSSTSEAEHQAQPGNSMKGTIDLTEENSSAPQSEDQTQNDSAMGEL